MRMKNWQLICNTVVMHKTIKMPLVVLIVLVNLLFGAACSEETEKRATQPVNNSSSAPAAIPCLDIVSQIVTTSPRYVKLTDGLTDRIIKNGGTSYGIVLEGSPEKTDESITISETYDFSLHETYPDHSPVIARFSFDPRTQKLYEYDVVNDSLVSITFDYNLLDKLNLSCK